MGINRKITEDEEKEEKLTIIFVTQVRCKGYRCDWRTMILFTIFTNKNETFTSFHKRFVTWKRQRLQVLFDDRHYMWLATCLQIITTWNHKNRKRCKILLLRF